MANNYIKIRRSSSSTLPLDGGANFVPADNDGKIGHYQLGYTEINDTLWYNQAGTMVKIGGDGWGDAKYVRHDVNTQGLTSPQKANARSNLDLGSASLLDSGTSAGDIAVLVDENGRSGVLSVNRLPTGTINGTIPKIGAGDKLEASIIPKAAVVDVYSVATIALRNGLLLTPGMELGDVAYVYAEAEDAANGYFQVIHQSNYHHNTQGSGGYLVTGTTLTVGDTDWDIQDGDVLRITYTGGVDTVHQVTAVSSDGTTLTVTLDAAVSTTSGDLQTGYLTRFLHASLPVDHTHDLGTLTGTVHADNLPVASSVQAGIVSIGAQTFEGDKTFLKTIETPGVAIPHASISGDAFLFRAVGDNLSLERESGVSSTPLIDFLGTGGMDFRGNPIDNVVLDGGSF